MFRRTDGKCFLCLAKNLVEDYAFPFNAETPVPVKAFIDRQGKKRLVMDLRRSVEGHPT